MMHKFFLRLGVVKTLVMSFVFALVMFAANTVSAQITPEQASKAIETELTTLKQELGSQTSATLNGTNAQADIAAAIKYKFYDAALTKIGKTGNVEQSISSTHAAFTANGDRPSSAVDIARDDLMQLINQL